MKKMIFSFLAFLALFSANASAALTASDVDFAPAIADTGVVFLALIGVAVILFGYRKVMALLSARG